MGHSSRTTRNRRGGALLEFALAGPVLLLMTLGAIDFGRAFYHAVTISNAAAIGAFTGARNTISSAHYDQMRTAATQDAQDIGTVTVTADRTCLCPPTSTNPNSTVVDCVTGTCAGYGSPRIYVSCQVEKNFRLAAAIPRIPNLFTVRRQVFMRVQ